MRKRLTSGKEICIYCRGVYGVRTFLKLRDLGIRVGCFGDADRGKCGYVLDGIFCISYQDVLRKDKENTVILVCKENPGELVEKFRQEGFSHVYSYEAVNELPQEAPNIVLDAKTICAINRARERISQKAASMREDELRLDSARGIAADLMQVLQDAKNRGEAAGETDAYR